MTVSVSDKTCTLTKSNVALSAGTYNYKIAVDGTWDISYPSSNKELTISEEGLYNITYTFNLQTSEVSATTTAITASSSVASGALAYLAAGTDVTLSASDGTSTFVYTTDDTEPTAANGTQATGSTVLNITETATVKVGILYNGNVYGIKTYTYTVPSPTITIYVKFYQDFAPYLYVWDNQNNNLNGDFPGTAMSQTVIIGDTKWWKQTFSMTGKKYLKCIISKTGEDDKTGDSNQLTNDAWFDYDGTNASGASIVALDAPAAVTYSVAFSPANAEGWIRGTSHNVTVTVLRNGEATSSLYAYYSLDGTNPSPQHERIRSGQTITLTSANVATLTLKAQAYSNDASDLAGDIAVGTYNFIEAQDADITIAPSGTKLGNVYVNKAEVTIAGGSGNLYYAVGGETASYASGNSLPEGGGTITVSTPGTLTVTDGHNTSTMDFDFTYSTSENYLNYYNNGTATSIQKGGGKDGITTLVKKGSYENYYFYAWDYYKDLRMKAEYTAAHASDTRTTDDNYLPLGTWPGTQLTTTEEKGGVTWYKVALVAPIDFVIINDGVNNSGNQTADIIQLSQDTYLTYDGTTGYANVTDQYIDNTNHSGTFYVYIQADTAPWLYAFAQKDIPNWYLDPQVKITKDWPGDLMTNDRTLEFDGEKYYYLTVDETNLEANQSSITGTGEEGAKAIGLIINQGGTLENSQATQTNDLGVIADNFYIYAGHGDLLNVTADVEASFSQEAAAEWDSFRATPSTITVVSQLYPNGKDYYDRRTDDLTYLLDPTWSGAITVSDGDASTNNWNDVNSGKSCAKHVTAGTRLQQRVTGLDNTKDYTVQAIIRTAGAGVLSLIGNENKAVATQLSSGSYIDKNGRVERLDSLDMTNKANASWYKLEQTVKPTTVGNIVITILGTADYDLADVTLLEGANTTGHYYTTGTATTDTKEIDLRSENAFSFFDRGKNLNGLVYALEKTVVGNQTTGHPYNVIAAASGATTGKMRMLNITERSVDGLNRDTDQGLAAFYASAYPFGMTMLSAVDAAKAKFDRTFTNVESTICLPFSVSAAQLPSGTTLEEVTSITSNTVTVRSASAMTANVPYIVKANGSFNIESAVQLANTGNPVSTNSEESKFRGVYELTTKMWEETIDGQKHNSFMFNATSGAYNRASKNGAKLKPFSAYIDVVDGDASAKALNIVFDDSTGISLNVNSPLSTLHSSLYDLQGRRVNNISKAGVYIVNGKKVIVK